MLPDGPALRSAGGCADPARCLAAEPLAAAAIASSLCDPDASRRQAAAITLYWLVLHEGSFRSNTAATQRLLPALVQMLGDGSSSGDALYHGARTIAILASESGIVSMLGRQEGLLQNLLTLLSSSDAQLPAAQALHALAQDASCAWRIACMPPDAWAALAAHTAMAPASVVQEVLHTLAAVENEATQHSSTILTQQAPGLGSGLLHVVGSSRSPPEVRAQARDVFVCLLARPSGSWVLPRLDELLSCLLGCLGSDGAEGLVFAARALGDLAGDPMIAGRLVTLHPGFEGLTKLLHGSAPAVARQAMCTLTILASTASQRERIEGCAVSGHPQLLSTVAAMMGSGTQPRDAVFNLFWRLAPDLMEQQLHELRGSLVGCWVMALGDGDPWGKAAAFGGLRRIADVPGGAEFVAHAPGVLGGLTALLSDAASDVCVVAAMHVLEQLAEHVVVRPGMLNTPDLVARLAILFMHSNIPGAAVHAGDTLSHLQLLPRDWLQSERVSMFRELLLRVSGDAVEGLQHMASSALQHIATAPHILASVAPFLWAEQPEVRQDALEVLYLLAHQVHSCRSSMAAEPGLLAGLVVCMREASSATQGAVAQVLRCLAAEPSATAHIAGEPGAIAGLAELLKGSAQLQVEAATALAHVADGAASSRASMAGVDGLVSGLLSMVCSNSSCVQAAALRAMGSLAAEPANRLLLGRQQGLLGRIVALLSSSSEDVSRAAAQALCHLVQEPELMLHVMPPAGSY